ncbi:MAG TPA: hypothetical protein V6C65_08595 [Allocoleopsis sp.]
MDFEALPSERLILTSSEAQTAKYQGNNNRLASEVLIFSLTEEEVSIIQRTLHDMAAFYARMAQYRLSAVLVDILEELQYQKDNQE